MKRKHVIITLVLLGIALGGFYVFRSEKEQAKEAQAEAARNAGRAVPVLSAQVAERDIPIYLEGLGNVTAFKSVTVKTQVDGRLDSVLFKEGQAVKAGDALAQIDPRPFAAQLHQAEGALARDKALLLSSQLDLTRYTDLAKEKLVSSQQVDQQRGLQGQYEGALRMDEAQVETAKLNLTYAHITSPIDGVTGIRQVDPGNVIHAADPTGIVVITQLDPIAIIFTLPQDDLPKVAKELLKGGLPVEAYSRDGEVKLGASGVLQLIDNQINQTTSTMRLKAIFPNPQHSLWPNQFVKTRLILTTRKKALVVPSTVVQRGPKGVFAYVIKEDQTVDVKPIEVELTQGDLTLIRSGLTVGEQVVVDGQNQLRPGSKVQARPAASTGDRPAATAPAPTTTPHAQPTAGRAPPAAAHAPSANPVPASPTAPEPASKK